MSETDARGAVVVGAGPGMGRALAVLLAREGFDVGLVGRRPEPLEAIAEEVRAAGGRAQPLVADLAVPGAVADALARHDDQVPTEVLAYNAVARSDDTLAHVATDELRAALEVNAISAVAAVQAVLPSLLARRGTVLVTGGASAVNPRAPWGVLSVGKAAVRAATLALADELEPLGVTVRTITIAGLVAPAGPLDPDEIAAALWALRTGDAVEAVFPG
jgi:short-subunit dehydrogenase